MTDPKPVHEETLAVEESGPRFDDRGEYCMVVFPDCKCGLEKCQAAWIEQAHVLPNCEGDYGQRLARAKLFAAAPDLARALRDLLDGTGGTGEQLCERAEAALRKAGVRS